MPIRITGLTSGLDTESIISALVSSYNYKTNKYKKAQTKLSWKQDAWKTLNTKIYSLYTSLDGLRFSKNYNLKTTTSSDTTKATVTTTNNAVNGTQKLNILQVAQAGYLTGGKLASGTTESTTLAELGYTGGDGTIDVNLGDGTKKSISVSQGTTVQQVINSLKDAGVNASYDENNKRIYVSSKETGTANDFTLTGANVDGSSALAKLGLCVGSSSTTATYESYTKYITSDGKTVAENVKSGVEAYAQALAATETAKAQNANLSAAYSYATAYSAMQDALTGSSLSGAQQEELKTLLAMTATERVNSVMGADGNVYTKTKTQDDGSIIYEKDGKYIQAVTTAKDDGNNVYTKNADGDYVDTNGLVYKATSEKDANGNKYYVYTAADGQQAKLAMMDETTTYYETTTNEVGTGLYKYTADDGTTYSPNDDGTFAGSDGKTYKLSDDGTTMQEYDKTKGELVTDGKSATVGAGTEVTNTEYVKGAEVSGVDKSSDRLTALKEASGLSKEEIETLTSNISKVNSFEAVSDTVLDETDSYTRANIVASIKAAYASGGATAVTTEVNTYADVIAANNTTISDGEKTMEENSALADLAKMDNTTQEYQDAVDAFVAKVNDAKTNMDYLNANSNSDASKIDGKDAKIVLNDIEYTGSSNQFSINGLMITAQAVTGTGDANAITITTQSDVQGMYDKIKDFLTQYNSLINEITSLYNADSAKGYEPLTDEEKDAMSDTEVEKWEDKIKASLLRRDDSLESIMNTMTSAMSKGYEINGKKYYLSTFGIKTLGYLNAAENEQNAYHIDGDEDDASVSGNSDKLMAALTEDPDSVIEFMQQLTNGLYESVGKKMQTSTLSSVYKVYNDKEMASEYSDYTDLIKKWEQKLQDQEDYYYNKFSAMETALSKLQSQTSSMSNLFGS
jgi:flagellar hook-associated protein 2